MRTRQITKSLLLTIFLLSRKFLFLNVKESDQKSDTGPIIGIDLGTTYSCVGVYKNGNVQIIPNELGNRITPSVVAFTDDEILIGEAAKNQASMNPKNTIYSIKRILGKNFNDKDIQEEKKFLPYSIINKNNRPLVQVEYKHEKKNYSPEEISSFILSKMKKIAETYLGVEVKKAVVTVPAYYKEAQRQATKDAGAIAGLDVVRILNEPTAAAVAFGLDKGKNNEQNILVYDLGGGTFDVSMLNIDQGVFEVIATNGDTHLGGDDFDNRALDYFIKKVKKQYNKDLISDSSALQKLKLEIEKAKRTLSYQKEAVIEIDELMQGLDFKDKLSRAKFEELNSELLKKTLTPINRILEDSTLNKNQVDEIVLVGGSTRIPKVQTLLSDFFNGKQLFKGINPDEAVAYGAAVQAGIIGGQSFKEDIIIVDIVSLTHGIETVGGVMANIIPRGTKIPTKKSVMFSTHENNQESVYVRVFEGERTMIKDNHFLGDFVLSGIPKASRGVPQIEITFDIDENSILKVSAIDKATNKVANTVIKSQTRNKEAIEKMIEDAERMKEEDSKEKEIIEAKLALENYLYSNKNLVSGINDNDKLAEKLSKEEKEKIMNHIQEVEEKLNANQNMDKEGYDNLLKMIKDVIDPIISKHYKNIKNDGVTENHSNSGNNNHEEGEEPLNF